MEKKIEISLEKCFLPFEHSFNRVKYFSCIIDNINIENFPCEWIIKNKSGVSYAMNTPAESEKEMLLHGFQYFIQRYLVRDCIESFALCLDKLFFSLLLHGKKVLTEKTLLECLNEQEKEFLKNFEKVGLSSQNGKVQILKEQFNLELSKDYNKIISGLKDIRNCLAHHNGIVRDIDGKRDGKGKRKFHWAAFSIWGIGTESGKKIDIQLNTLLEEATKICGNINLQDNYKSFKIDEPLSFTSAETYEIAWSLQLVAREYLKKVGQTILVA